MLRRGAGLCVARGFGIETPPSEGPAEGRFGVLTPCLDAPRTGVKPASGTLRTEP